MAKDELLGSDLIEMLIQELECSNKAQLAQRLDVAAAQIQAWENAAPTKTIVRNIIRKVRDAAVSRAISPIVEFHQLNHSHGHKADTLRKKIDNEKICERLGSCKGIYSFYDSNGRIVYVGKTEDNNLLSEMTQAFGLIRPNYVRKLANRLGKFVTSELAIRDTAEFVSAYEVDSNVIGNVEAFLTRIVPNDVVNKKTENFR